MEENILIVGAGIFGVSTAYHLALTSNPARITLLDRAAPPSSVAASTDINKIIRADYSNPLYMDLGFEAIEAWKNLPCFRDAGVYHQSGWIAMDERHSDVPARIRQNFRNSGREDVIENLTAEEVRNRWSVLRQTDCTPFGSYYYNPSAGWADAGQALQIMAQETVKLGINYQVGEARRIVWGNGRVEGVETEKGQVFKADKVLLATGAWTSQLMSSVEDELGLSETERVESQVSATGVSVAHFQLSELEKRIYDQLPVFVYGGLGMLKKTPFAFKANGSRRGNTSDSVWGSQVHLLDLVQKHHRDSIRPQDLRSLGPKPMGSPKKASRGVDAANPCSDPADSGRQSAT